MAELADIRRDASIRGQVIIEKSFPSVSILILQMHINVGYQTSTYSTLIKQYALISRFILQTR